MVPLLVPTVLVLHSLLLEIWGAIPTAGLSPTKADGKLQALFGAHMTWKSCVLLTQVTSAPFQFTKSNCWSPSSSRMLQHRIASLCVLILCSSCWQHRVLPLAKHICCSSRAVCHPALLHQYKSCHNRDFQVGWKRKLSDLGGTSFQPTCPLLFTSFSFPQEK